MRVFLALCFAVMCRATVMASAANAGQCPAQDPRDKLKIVAEAPSCREAARLFKLCALGSAFDGALSAPVSEACERDALVNLSPPRRKAYEAALKACNDRYARKPGPLFLSHAAFCRVGAMEKYGRRR